jgi:hypothetical protein
MHIFRYDDISGCIVLRPIADNDDKRRSLGFSGLDTDSMASIQGAKSI